VDGGVGVGDEEEPKSSEGDRGVHAGVGVACFNSGKESRRALR
jgi:hypothetical protein